MIAFAFGDLHVRTMCQYVACTLITKAVEWTVVAAHCSPYLDELRCSLVAAKLTPALRKSAEQHRRVLV